MASKVEEAMVDLNVPVRQVMRKINLSGFGIAVVVDDCEKVIATVTDGDIRRAILGNIDLDLPIQTLLDQQIHSRGNPIVALEGTDQSELLEMMRYHSVRQIPLIDQNGCLVDIAVLNALISEQELPITAVVMAGGYGTRLRPLTEQLPKPMLPVGDKPLLELIIQQLSRSGIHRVNLTTHYKADKIIEYFGNGRNFGVDISYVEEDEPLGTAGSLSLLEDSDLPVLVINGDILTKVDFRAMLEFHAEHVADMTVAVRQHEFLIPYGVVDTNGSHVNSITEKPVMRHLINAGMYLLGREALKFIPIGEPYTMPELISKLITEGKSVISFPVEEYWLDIGHQADYAQAQEDAKKEGF